MSQPLEQVDIDDTPAENISTPTLEGMLRAKFDRQQYALLFDVPDAVSLAQKRRIDAIAFGLWASGGQEIQGFELKVSRSDWLRELKQVDKADPFIALCDRFWLVTADNKIAKDDEIPACWGWMAATKAGLRVQRPARRLPGCGDAVPRSFVLGVMRKLQESMLSSPDVQAVIDERVKIIQDRKQSDIEFATKDLRRARDEALKAVKDFEEISGINLMSWRWGNVAEIVKGLRELGYGDGIDRVPRLLEEQENVLRMTLQNVSDVRTRLAAHRASLNSEQP